MNYDDWKLGSGIDPRYEAMAEQCQDIEKALDTVLTAAAFQSSAEWTIEPVLVDFTDGGDFEGELSLRLIHIEAKPRDWRYSARAIAGALEDLAAEIRRTETKL